MDLKVYYRKIKELVASMLEEFVILVSNETADGGRAGRMTEVGKHLAARMIVEGKARMASTEEAEQYREQVRESRRAAEEEAARSRLQVTVISNSDLQSLRETKGKK